MESTDKNNRPSKSSSLELTEKEAEAQVRELALFASALGRETKNKQIDARRLVFAGSGDSYAASLFAHYLSGELAVADDPYELLLAPNVCEKKTVFITSVSGRTSANVKLARRLNRLARDRIAITADPESPLARECDQTIRLPYTTRGVTSGTLSFTLSLLAVASRLRQLPSLNGLRTIWERSEGLISFGKGLTERFLFVGTGIGYSLAAYGAFKMHEVFGCQADYEHTEQIGHSRLFSLKKTDSVIFVASRPDRMSVDTSRDLSRHGFRTQLITSSAKDPVIAGLEIAFALQHLAIDLAKKTRLKELAFVTNRKILRLSSRLIY